MHDLAESRDFARREITGRDQNRQQLGLQMIASRFSDSSKAMLQELVDVAVKYCGADSAGVSLEEPDGKGKLHFRWVAVAGSFEKYLNGTTPRDFSPCGVCLDEWKAQHYKVTQPYYDFLGVIAEPIKDGLLIPWKSDTQRGTIWAVSHQSDVAFDVNDYMLLQRLADVVSLAMRHRESKPA